MSPELISILTLLSRMEIVAALVVTASIITERFGPTIGALIATLPISAGPSFVFLALDHDTPFIAESALASLPVNAATIFLLLSYAVLALRHGMVIATGPSVAVWLVLAFIVCQFEWTLAGGLVAKRDHLRHLHSVASLVRFTPEIRPVGTLGRTPCVLWQ